MFFPPLNVWLSQIKTTLKQPGTAMIAAVAIVCGVQSGMASAASFQGLGDLSAGEGNSFESWGHLPSGAFYSVALGISGNGSVVAVQSNSANGLEASLWTSETGLVGLGDLPGAGVPGIGFYSVPRGVSGNGLVLVGRSNSAQGIEAFRWTEADGMVGLGDLPGGAFDSMALAVSWDGSVIVGQSQSNQGLEAFRWTEADGMVGLGDLPGGRFESSAAAISANGLAIVGQSNSTNGANAFRWSQASGMVNLGDLAGGASFSSAHGISADGLVVVGQSESARGIEAFRWTRETGMVGLGDLPGGGFYSIARGISADSSVVVGFGNTERGNEAFIWNATSGMRNLREVLIALGLDMTGWQLYQARAISSDGSKIVGFGVNPQGQAEAWLADLTLTPKVSTDEPSLTLLGVGTLLVFGAFFPRKSRKNS